MPKKKVKKRKKKIVKKKKNEGKIFGAKARKRTYI